MKRLIVLCLCLGLMACANTQQNAARLVELYQNNRSALCAAATQVCAVSPVPTPAPNPDPAP